MSESFSPAIASDCILVFIKFTLSSHNQHLKHAKIYVDELKNAHLFPHREIFLAEAFYELQTKMRADQTQVEPKNNNSAVRRIKALFVEFILHQDRVERNLAVRTKQNVTIFLNSFSFCLKFF